MMDPELAEWIVDQLDEYDNRHEDPPPPEDSFIGETEEVSLLRDILNAVRHLQTPILAPWTKSPPKVMSISGPVPKWKRVQDERDADSVDEMLAYYGIE